MPNIVTTNHTYPSSIALSNDYHGHRDEVFVFTGAATLLPGTILGRVTASGKLRPYAAGNGDGSEVPRAVLTYEIQALGAGDVAGRALVKGDVNRNRLILAADGHGNNITAAMLDQLRDYGINPVDVQALGQVV